jgi:putative SOS response-associated peptidase YedK
VVLADGFYEWVRGPGDKRQPLWIHPRACRLMLVSSYAQA